MKRKLTAMTCVFLFLLLAGPRAGLAGTPDALIVTTDDQGTINYVDTRTGTISPEQVYVDKIGAFCYGAGIGDFDNDGTHDIVVVRDSFLGGQAFIYTRDETGTVVFPPACIHTWNTRINTRDIAVGDFNGDGNLDFVISLENTESCKLYQGDGNLTFAAHELVGTTPVHCMGIDAADFNNDGHEDFIAASYEASTCQLYVNMGNGDGSFSVNVTTLDPGHNVWGIAAADFDNDGTVDIVATFDKGVYFYGGNGDGTFRSGHKVIDNEAMGSYSPVDNYDFDGNGNQDIVIGNYSTGASAGQTAVALYYGTGTGTFSTTPDVRAGGSGSERIVVTTPPCNKKIAPPHAIAKPAYQEITVGHAAVLDASDSYSPNGAISCYEWDFGDGTLGGGETNPHAYNSVGLYTATLTVTDERGAQDTTTVTVKVLPVQARINILPNYLKLDGRKGRVSAVITLPSEYSVSKIDLTSVSLARDDSPLVYAINKTCYGFSARIKRHFLKKGILYVKFDKKAIADIIDTPSAKTVLRIQGKVSWKGRLVDFTGKDTITTTTSGRHHNRHFRWYRNFSKALRTHAR